MTFKTALVAAAVSLAAIAVPAHAAPTRKVSYADLDLSTARGQAELQRRVSKAARQVCQYFADGTLMPAETHEQCYRMARTQASERTAALIADSQRGG